MKKLLLLACTAILGLTSVNAQNVCLVDSEQRSLENVGDYYRTIDLNSKHYINMSLEIWKSSSSTTAQGTTLIQYTTNGDDWVTTKELSKSDLSTSAQTFYFTVPFNATKIRVYRNDVIYKRYMKNLKAYEGTELLSDATLNIGNVVVGTTGQATASIGWAMTAGTVSSDNGLFTVDPKTFGSTDECATDKTDITITFTPTATGAQTANITIGDKAVVVNATATLPIPTGLNVDEAAGKEIYLSWNAVDGATGYRVFNKTLSTYNDVTGTNYTWTDLDLDTNYSFTVASIADGSIISNESEAVSATTLYYDPNRCILKMDDQEYNFTSGTDKSYILDTDKVSPFQVHMTCKLAKEDGVTLKNVTIKSSNEDLKTLITTDLPTYDSFKQYGEYTASAGTTSFSFSTLATKKIYVKNIVVYAEPGLEAGVSELDFGDIEDMTPDTLYVTVKFANTADLTTSVDGEGFSVGDFDAKESCEVGTIDIPVIFKAEKGWTAGEKTATLTINNGLETTVSLKANLINDIPTAAAEYAADGAIVSAANGVISIANINAGDNYAVYDINGKLIAAGVAKAGSVSVVLPAGQNPVIVKVNDKAVTVAY